MTERDLALKSWKKSGISDKETLHKICKKLRNKCVKEIRRDVRNKYVNKLNNGDVWKVINSIRGKQLTKSLGYITNEQGVDLKDGQSKAEVFSYCFQKKIWDIRNSIVCSPGDNLLQQLRENTHVQNMFQFAPVSEQ